MMTETTTDVLVVGAGPTGLALAAELARLQAPALVVDAQAAGANTSRAAVVHARTLEALEPLAVAGRLHAAGIEASLFTIRDRDHVLVSLDFSGLDTAYPYALLISQADTERILLGRLLELGGAVLRPRTLVALRQDKQQVFATLDDGVVVRAQYVVGADGMHSAVRELAGIAFEGGSYEESFLLADVELDGAVPDREVIMYLAPAGLMLLAPLPGGTHRVAATLKDAPRSPGTELVQQLLDTRGPTRKRLTVKRVLWGSRFHVHHRIAAHYRAGRVVLAGDAAHVHSPAGGQGMNMGIQDGIALAPMLVQALKIGTPEALVRYEAQRKKVALQVIALTDRMTRLATVGPALQPLRNLALRLSALSPALRWLLTSRLAGLVYR
jgi:2-polyprenyl-6-methoxyphenol hydroxylase-like FAD-dependent oxidoreductase